ncbi:hypothetical protein Psch_03561 [Pelotomaculum schinkii]|uniref:Uncharacterized protein n=1 Tax=Pelotomaculum schinkii TaxID=78350 RepID=A0A4Y7R7U7_9FIRM|nr:hypothetical protein Psch_03561 [Pelotomaculum schinkii]
MPSCLLLYSILFGTIDKVIKKINYSASFRMEIYPRFSSEGHLPMIGLTKNYFWPFRVSVRGFKRNIIVKYS